MSTYSKEMLSGATDGKPILVAATAIGSGTTIHTCGGASTATKPDLVTLYAHNADTVQRILTIGWGGTTDPDHVIVQTLAPRDGLVVIVQQLYLRNSLIVKAACDVASKVTLMGHVDRIT